MKIIKIVPTPYQEMIKLIGSKYGCLKQYDDLYKRKELLSADEFSKIDKNIDEMIDRLNTSILEQQALVGKELIETVKETGYINHCPDLQGGAYDKPFHIKSKISYGGGWYISTYLNLSGRGIKLSGDGTDNTKGFRTYHVTNAAFNKLEKQYLIINIELLD